MGRLVALDHVQLAMPAGGEPEARRFYVGILGLREVDKPAHLRKRGGCWLESAGIKVHLGVEPDFRPSRKAHPAFLVDALCALVQDLRRSGFEPAKDEPLEGYDRRYVSDPFGNRIELMQAIAREPG